MKLQILSATFRSQFHRRFSWTGTSDVPTYKNQNDRETIQQFIPKLKKKTLFANECTIVSFSYSKHGYNRKILLQTLTVSLWFHNRFVSHDAWFLKCVGSKHFMSMKLCVDWGTIGKYLIWNYEISLADEWMCPINITTFFERLYDCDRRIFKITFPENDSISQGFSYGIL